MTPRVGDILDDKYKLTQVLGRGGMGTVFRGTHVHLGREVAIKILNRSVVDDKIVLQRFEREAKAAASVGSDHIVQVIDIGHVARVGPYMVMEFVEGDLLTELMEREPELPSVAACELVSQILAGLMAAHAAGVIHRDLKPDNIILSTNRQTGASQVKILDFGVSKFLNSNETTSVTATGVLVGTPYFMAPEQAKGGKYVDHRADLFSVGVLLFRAITGTFPFVADNVAELLYQLVLDDAPPISRFVPSIDREVEAIVARALARNRDDRFSSAEEMKQRIDAYLVTNGVDLPGVDVTSAELIQIEDTTADPPSWQQQDTTQIQRADSGTTGGHAQIAERRAPPKPPRPSGRPPPPQRGPFGPSADFRGEEATQVHITDSGRFVPIAPTEVTGLPLAKSHLRPSNNVGAAPADASGGHAQADASGRHAQADGSGRNQVPAADSSGRYQPSADGSGRYQVGADGSGRHLAPVAAGSHRSGGLAPPSSLPVEPAPALVFPSDRESLQHLLAFLDLNPAYLLGALGIGIVLLVSAIAIVIAVLS